MIARVRFRLPAARRSPGFVLLAVMIVILLASMIAISLMFQMGVEEKSTAAGAGAEQAWAAAMAGVRKAMQAASTNNSTPIDWRDNPDYFRAQLVVDDGSEQWRFTVFSGGGDPETPIRHGLTDEAGKLNLNHATEEALGLLPRMEPSLTHALLDFIDADSDPRPEGAEQIYYDGLTRPYRIHNRRLTTVDELLLVRGFTKEMVFGEDANRNFRLDGNEDDGELRFPPDNGNGALNPGLRPFLTVSSYEPNVSMAGELRVDINDAGASLPTNGLPESVAGFITALRRNKASLGHPSALLEERRTMPDETGEDREYDAGVGEEELPAVLDLLTNTNALELVGLINVNTASATALQTVAGIDEALAEAIVSARAGLSEESRRTTAWLFTESLVDAEEFRAIAPGLTARGFQFSFRVIGYGANSGRFRALEVIVDTADGTPEITYLRDITRLGLPFPLPDPNELDFGLSAASGN